MQIKFTVLGEPQGKGRPKFSRQGGLKLFCMRTSSALNTCGNLPARGLRIKNRWQ